MQAKSEWVHADPGIQAAVTSTIAPRLDGFSPLLLSRACLVLAAGAATSADACSRFLQQATAWPRKVVALELLVALAEETNAPSISVDDQHISFSPAGGDSGVTDVIKAASPQVLAYLADIAVGGDGTDEGPQLRITLVKCLYGWAHTFVEIDRLSRAQPSLLHATLAALQDEAAFGVAVDLLEYLLEIPADLNPPGQSHVDESAIIAVASSLVEGGRKLQADGGEDDELALGLCRLLGRMLKCQCHFLATGSPLALQVVELALYCSSLPDRLAGPALLFKTWPRLLQMPELRAPEVNQAVWAPLERRLLECVIQQASYPSDFTDWEAAAEMGSDEFLTFREQILLDILEGMYGRLKLVYLQLILQVVQGGAERACWQQAEAGMFVLHAVALDAKRDALGRGQGVSHEQKELIAQTVAAMLELGLRGEPSQVHPSVARAVCQLVGDFSQYICKDAASLIPEALRYIPGALVIGAAWDEASRALRILSQRAPMADEATLTTLAQACDDAARSGMQVEHRCTAAQALSQVAGQLPVHQAEALLQRLCSFSIQRLQGMLMMGLHDLGAADEIGVLAATIRSIDISLTEEGQRHPVETVVTGLSPMLQQSATTWSSSEAVAGRLCEFYLNASRQLPSMRQTAAQVILGLLPRHPAVCIDAMGGLLDGFHGEEGEAAALSALGKSVEAMSALAGEGNLDSSPDAARAALELVRQLVRDNPATVFSANCKDALHAHLGLAVECVKMSHPDSTRAALLLLKEVTTAETQLAMPAARALYQEHVAAWLDPRCDEIVFYALEGVSGLAPEFLVEPLAHLLHALLGGVHRSAAKASLRRWLEGKGEGITDDGKRLLMEVVEVEPPLGLGELASVMELLSKSCRNASGTSTMNGLTSLLEERARRKAGMQA